MRDSNGVKVTWIGHATVLFETADARLITDPLLRPRIVHLRRHAAPVQDPGQVDAVLLSHLHHDHLDLRSLKALGAPVVAVPGGARALRSVPVEVRELAPGSAVSFGSTEVTAVPAVHDGRRWPIGEQRDDDAVGFVVAEAGRRVYFAGDTEAFDAMRELPPLDLALVPIWGWGTSLGPGHMDPSEAAGALRMLRPAVAVPIHWGTFLPIGLHRRHGHLLRDPAQEFAERAAAEAPDVRVVVLEPGESLEV